MKVKAFSFHSMYSMHIVVPAQKYSVIVVDAVLTMVILKYDSFSHLTATAGT